MRNSPPSQHLVFDCDPGCDDALAIALVAKAQRYKRIDLLTVAGNVPVEQTTANACRLAALLGIQTCTRIYRGCARSLMGDTPTAASVHGRDGLGDAPNNLLDPPLRPRRPKSCMNAVERLVQLASSKDKTVVFDMVCTGPLTNLATALGLMDQKRRRAFWARCSRLIVMGGCFNSKGNITHSAEFNTYFDPVATQTILDYLREVRDDRGAEVAAGNATSPEPQMYFVPLDSTETVGISLLEQSEKPEPHRAAKFLFYALQQYGEFHAFHCKRPAEAKAFGIKEFDEEAYVNSLLGGSLGVSKLNKFCFLHDPLAMWALLRWEDARPFWADATIRVDAGRGDSRGRIISCEPKASTNTPVKAFEIGTHVKWLSLPIGDADAATFRREFVTAVAKLLCLPVETTVQPVRKPRPPHDPGASR